MFRAALIIALVAGLVSVSVSVTQVKEKITTLQADLTSTRDNLSNTQRNLRETSATLKETQENLKVATADLVDTRSQLDQTIRQRDELNKLAQEKMAQLEETEKSLSDANSKLSRWDALGLQPDGVRQMQADFPIAGHGKAEQLATGARHEKLADKHRRGDTGHRHGAQDITDDSDCQRQNAFPAPVDRHRRTPPQRTQQARRKQRDDGRVQRCHP